MNIAFFIRAMDPSGVATFVIELGAFLVRAGHTITLVACGQGAWWPRLAENGIATVLAPPGPSESAAGYARRLAGHFSAARYDVVFLNNGQGVQPAMLGLHRWPDSVAAVPVLHSNLARVYAHAQINQAAWNAAVAVSPRVRDTAAALLPGKTVLCIPCGVRQPTDTQRGARLAWESPLRLLFVGGLYDQCKGILRLPRILAECRARGLPVRLTVIGAGGDRARLAQTFADRGLADLVVWRGTVPNAEVHQAMRTHHSLLVPSNYEGLSLVSLEAQANGCVPVASRLPGVLDVAIEDQVSGYLVEPDDIQAYVERIAWLSEAGRWQRLSQAGMARVPQLFSVDVMGQRYLELVEQIAAGAYPLAQPRARTARGSYRLFQLRDYVPGPARRWGARLIRLWRGRILRPDCIL